MDKRNELLERLKKALRITNAIQSVALIVAVFGMMMLIGLSGGLETERISDAGFFKALIVLIPTLAASTMLLNGTEELARELKHRIRRVKRHLAESKNTNKRRHDKAA